MLADWGKGFVSASFYAQQFSDIDSDRMSSRNMTIPSRPAPPPPQQQQRSTTAPSRYTPTTDWDFCAFGTASGPSHQQQQLHGMKQKKAPPPRPPPPKVQSSQLGPIVPALKKPGQPQSINILSSLFGQKRSSNGSSANSKTNISVVQKSNSSSSSVPIKLLPPPAPLAPPPSTGSAKSGGNASYGSFATSSGTGTAANSGDMQLITFDSPPSSPTFTQKSCSDCISVDSFSSDSNYSSPNGGNMSQAESGFEDDFVASASGGVFTQSRSGSAGMTWGDLIDPFESNGSGRTVNYAPLPLTTAQVRAPLVNSKLQQSDFIDPLCNGRTVTSKIPTVSMPTIIKPPTAGSGSQKSTPQHVASTSQASARANLSGGGVFVASKGPTTAAPPPAVVDYFSTEVNSFDSLPSLPMPTIPPPPPPPVSSSSSAGVVDTAEEPYGIALYNFEGETDEDLTLKVNEKIYLLRRITDEWYMGRDRRGLVGMFPVNYVEVKVPLSSDDPAQSKPSATFASSAAVQHRSDAMKVRALYHFAAETPEDLTLREDDLVTVLYQITPEWLYGEVNGRRGQFPANFIEYVPPNLPTKTTNSGV